MIEKDAMTIRQYTDADLARVKELYNGKPRAWQLPDLSDRRMLLKQVVDDDGKVVLAAFGRAQLNISLVLDHTWRTPAERLEALEMLSFAMTQLASLAGFDEATAQIFDRRFGERLRAMGWHPSPGMTWHKDF